MLISTVWQQLSNTYLTDFDVSKKLRSVCVIYVYRSKRRSIVISNLIMKRSRNKSNWGEWPETYDAKYQIHDVFTAFEPEKRTQVEMLGPIDEPDTDTT